MSNPIPKSLHTIRVLVVMAKVLIRASSPTYTTTEAVDEACCLLGYASSAPDDYGLKARAVAQLDAGQ